MYNVNGRKCYPLPKAPVYAETLKFLQDLFVLQDQSYSGPVCKYCTSYKSCLIVWADVNLRKCNSTSCILCTPKILFLRLLHINQILKGCLSTPQHLADRTVPKKDIFSTYSYQSSYSNQRNFPSQVVFYLYGVVTNYFVYLISRKFC